MAGNTMDGWEMDKSTMITKNKISTIMIYIFFKLQMLNVQEIAAASLLLIRWFYKYIHLKCPETDVDLNEMWSPRPCIIALIQI